MIGEETCEILTSEEYFEKTKKIVCLFNILVFCGRVEALKKHILF